ncbi:L,D-transpeptidase family protein [Aureimonas jatrophae]|uniref:Murein L,D-transpeptidase YcbB/YkuD n=1 Tax=Aureimonas jatrophae TaxID=1166073 RepID=A0A1H0GSH2_9HYPH|nr:L,D-transpeptidase family protein [Aureimonas jatrophae]MBB3949762.1 murein L,D-transpeptidase YcbB/YkuD [Aureimonas jatrophae]SDO10026.1 Murein L,D-transpeptidase YcbB/YkuD [Aureimonas jatrophae]
MTKGIPDRNRPTLSRRTFVAGAAGLFGAGAISGVARAQSALEGVLSAPNRGGWTDQFDTRAASVRNVASYQPVFSPNTLSAMQQAVGTYNQIAMSGGWPQVPETGKLQIGAQNQAVSLLRQRLAASGDLDRSAGNSTAFDTYVDAAVKRFQARHGLPADGAVGEYTYKALNVPADVRLMQLQTNIQRLSAIQPDPGRFVMVNIPAASIEAVENGRVVQRHTAVVGKIDRQTPILDSKITNLNLNPYWHAPASIVRKDIIPLMQKDPTYLTRNDIVIYAADGSVIPPETINWNTDEAVKYLFRQNPGRMNAMSSVKINFPNPYAVYMHDTPQQSVFSQLMRFESSGCVRVQNVRDLIVWLARDTPGWDRSAIERTISARTRQDVNLTNPVPLHFTYLTAWATDPTVVQFRDDIYRRDGAEQLAMSEAQPTAYAAGEQAYADLPY